MALFEVTVRGRGLWVDIDGEIQRVGFRVMRVVDATSSTGAAEKALALIRDDPKTRPLAGRLAPDLFAEQVVPADAKPAVDAGFRFFPDAG